MSRACSLVDEKQLRAQICELGHRLWQREYVASNDGNISVIMSPDTVLCTPTGVSKGFMTPDMLIKIDRQGKKLDGYLKPSSEIKMHLRVYDERPDICAVIHAHPPTATGFAVAGVPLTNMVLPEIIITLKAIPLAKYGTPSTPEIPDALMPFLQEYDAFLLENHGALTLGKDLLDAYHKMEQVEGFARISLTARLLGSERALPPQDVDRLLEMRRDWGLEERSVCLACGACDAEAGVGDLKKDQKPSASLTDPELHSIVRAVTEEILSELNKSK